MNKLPLKMQKKKDYKNLGRTSEQKQNCSFKISFFSKKPSKNASKQKAPDGPMTETQKYFCFLTHGGGGEVPRGSHRGYPKVKKNFPPPEQGAGERWKKIIFLKKIPIVPKCHQKTYFRIKIGHFLKF
jgi:hypothetical protein